MKWLKNSSGKPDAMLTFATISFLVVTLNMLLATLKSLSINGSVVEFQYLDVGTMTAYLGATFTAYVSRKWTDKRYAKEEGAEAGNV